MVAMRFSPGSSWGENTAQSGEGPRLAPWSYSSWQVGPWTLVRWWGIDFRPLGGVVKADQISYKSEWGLELIKYELLLIKSLHQHSWASEAREVCLSGEVVHSNLKSSNGSSHVTRDLLYHHGIEDLCLEAQTWGHGTWMAVFVEWYI